MEKQEENSPIEGLSGFIKAELLRRQAEIEEQTGNKPALEDLFAEMKAELFKIVPGKEQTNDTTPPAYELKVPGALPGVRRTIFHTSFIPDLPLISHWKRAASVFYTGYTESETESLHRLYLNPKFQRLSIGLEGRMAIVAFIEGRDLHDYPKESHNSYNEYYGALEHELNQPPERYGELAKAFIDSYGEKYGLKWLVHNEPPLPKIFLDTKWLSGISLRSCWWQYVKDFIADDFKIPEIVNLSDSYVEKQVEWMIGLSKFQKLSRTLLGRLDMICSIERCPKERMMKNLQIGNGHLVNYEENEELIRERVTEMFGMNYGSLWVAYGLVGGVDYKFIYYALDNKLRFLDRIPALFRSSNNRVRILYEEENTNENDELSGVEKKRVCLHCGKPIEGRSNKVFCDGGACQRTYYNHRYRRNETLNGHEEETVTTAPEQEQQEPTLLGTIGELIKGPAGAFINKFMEDGAGRLSESLFGKKADPTPQAEQNNPAPPDYKSVSGDELLKKQRDTGAEMFSPEFTTFFGNFHIPFRMLIWGKSGQGKSSFCLKFCQALGLVLPGTYISAEEDPQGVTMQDKILLNCKGKLNMRFVNWLPSTKEKWHELVFRKDEKGQTRLNSFYVVYDSISKMEQKPGLADRVQKLIDTGNFNEALSHIYIAHAENDGSTYIGDAGWEYEADIVIRVHGGIAYMMKNRFKTATIGLIGGKFNFFEQQI